MNTTGKVLTALAAGAVAGAILGVLFAPAKGSETRQSISDKANDLAGDVKNIFGKCRDKFEKAAGEAEKEFA